MAPAATSQGLPARVLVAASCRKERVATGGSAVEDSLLPPPNQRESPGEPRSVCLRLPHPATGKAATFLLVDGVLQELQVFRQKHSAWLAGERSVADGGLWLASPVDPLLVLLPALETARGATEDRPDGMFKPASEALMVEAFPSVERLATLVEPEGQLDCICDKKSIGCDNFYRLNDSKVLVWLGLKVEATREAIKASQSVSLASMEASELEEYAVGLLSEYLPARWQANLRGSRDLDMAKPLPQPIKPQGNKWAEQAARDAEDIEAASKAKEIETQNKRSRIDPRDVSKQRAKDRAKAAKAEQKANQIKRENRGMASISSFFAKK